MKYYSEMTHKFYDELPMLQKEEQALKEKIDKQAKAEEAKKAKRAARAKEVEEALKLAEETTLKAQTLLKSFVKDYGSFHTTIHKDKYADEKDAKNNDIFADAFSDVLSTFLNSLF